MHKRPHEITEEFIRILEQPLLEIIAGNEEDFMEIRAVAEKLYIHPTHLSNTIKATTGKSPCEICHDMTIKKAKELLTNSSLSIAEVATLLTYDPSNFTKYFKNRTGFTPSGYRTMLLQNNSETITIF